MIKSPTPAQVIALRKRFKMTAQEFADIVYMTQDSVYSWEAGRRQCPPAVWELLLIFFGKAQPRRYTEPAKETA